MTDEPRLPAVLSRLWSVSEQSRLGRPAELDVAQVVQAAVAVADRDGLMGVTLPKVATTLGFTSMSLYRYIGSKDELLVLMRDVALGAPPEIAAAAVSWRDGLRQWAVEQHRLLMRRPWIAQLPVSGPPAGPHEIAWMDAGLAVLRDTGLDWADKIGVISVIGGFVRHSVLLSKELAHGRAEGIDQAQAVQDYGRALVGLVDPGRFPDAAKMFASTVFEPRPRGTDPLAGSDFIYGLELILDGTSAAIGRAEAGPPEQRFGTSSR